MFASIRRFQCNLDQVPEAMRRVDEIFAPRLEAMPGFIAYEVVDCGDGDISSITFCRDHDAVERSVVLSAEFVRDDLADIEIQRVEALHGEVTVSRAVQEMLEPAHV